MIINTKEKTILKNAIFVFITLTFVLTTSAAFGYGSYGTDVNNYCPSPDPYTGDCTFCHTGSKGDPTPMKEAYVAGTLEYFCPAPVDPSTIDDDGDGYTESQGDCNDAVFAVNPGATDVCGDGIDQDCNNRDAVCPVDPNTVDNDGDNYTENQGDCNDNKAAIKVVSV